MKIESNWLNCIIFQKQTIDSIYEKKNNRTSGPRIGTCTALTSFKAY